MTRRASIRAFLHSREGNGWIAVLLFSAALSFVAAYGFYQSSVRSFVNNKSDEKTTAMRLVDAFVSNYSAVRHDFGSDAAPVPASFRAHSIELFNQSRGAADTLRLHWIGRAGHAIVTGPTDPAMAEVIESFVGNPDPQPMLQLVRVGGRADLSHRLSLDRPRPELCRLPQQTSARRRVAAQRCHGRLLDRCAARRVPARFARRMHRNRRGDLPVDRRGLPADIDCLLPPQP